MTVFRRPAALVEKKPIVEPASVPKAPEDLSLHAFIIAEFAEAQRKRRRAA